MLNDGLLADLGFDPVTATVVATVVSKIVSFGPTQEFRERQAYRDAGAEILAKVKALIPSLPQWIQKTVTDDREEFRQKMIRPNMKLSDYKAAVAWIEGREGAWQIMLQQGPSATGADVPSGGADLRRQIYVNTLRREAGDVVTPSGAGVVTAPSAVIPQEAGFNWPVMVVIGGALAWLLLGQKK